MTAQLALHYRFPWLPKRKSYWSSIRADILFLIWRLFPFLNMHFYPPDILIFFFAKLFFSKSKKNIHSDILIFFFAKKKTLRKSHNLVFFLYFLSFPQIYFFHPFFIRISLIFAHFFSHWILTGPLIFSLTFYFPHSFFSPHLFFAYF